MTDIHVEQNGSIVIFRAETKAGEEWINEHVQAEPWQWLGSALAVDRRFGEAIFKGATEAGLKVEC